MQYIFKHKGHIAVAFLLMVLINIYPSSVEKWGDYFVYQFGYLFPYLYLITAEPCDKFVNLFSILGKSVDYGMSLVSLLGELFICYIGIFIVHKLLKRYIHFKH